MIHLDTILVIARAERRLTRRLVRYWVFVVLAWMIGTAGYLQYAVALHMPFSAYSATAASINSRYLVALYGTWYLLVFLIGLIFLAFDVRTRDVRERMVEVLDAKPYSNTELILGRFFGLLVMAWIPVVLITAFLEILGLIIKEPIQPWSLLEFTVFMALPSFMFAIGLVFLTSIVVRFRLLTFIIVIGILIGAVFGAGQRLPIAYGGLSNITGAFATGYSSDFVAFGAGFPGIAQRLGFAFLGLTLALLAAALYPRLDGESRSRKLTVVGVAAAVTAAMFVVNIQTTRSYLTAFESWYAAHDERSDEPAPDILAMSVDATIKPGRTLDLVAEIRFAAPPGTTLESALFSLNPGFEITRLTDSTDREIAFTFEDGLLEIDLPTALASGEESTFNLSASGFPLENFAYLDAVKHPLKMEGRDGGLFLLGFQPMMFSKGYVALMPAARWLPSGGSDLKRDGASDFFDLDLIVEIPDSWLVAGPGKRLEGPPAGDGSVRYRFTPPAPVPEVALLASQFESRSADINGIRFEVLSHPDHVSNVDFFDDAGTEIRNWIAEKLDLAEQLGLPYPYDGMTLVEVPYALRAFGGGWRMDSTLAPPAMLLMRECAFPTARFDIHLKDPEEFQDREGGLPRAKLEWVIRFFENDFTGGDIFVGAARNNFAYQTSAVGPDGVALDFVTNSLATRLLSGRNGYFSAHIFDRELNAIAGAIIQRMVASSQSGEELVVTDVVIQELTSRMEVWDQALGVSLAGLEPWDDPRRTLDVLTLKGDAMARSLVDELGRVRVARLLSTLRERNLGGTFDRAELIAAAEEIGEDLAATLELWLDATELPGFVLENADAFRLSDDEDGNARYQILVTLRNDEPVGGMIKVDYSAGDAGQDSRNAEHGSGEPIYVAGLSEVEIGIVTSQPPQSVSIRPYLSLNREAFRSDLPTIDEQKLNGAEPLSGHRETEWTPSDDEVIVVDDLDEGFEVVDGDGRSGLRLGTRATDEPTDQGLPIAGPISFSNPPSRWSRRASTTAWGKYRHTVALVKSGTGDRRAVFTARVPRSGSWELQLHLPSQRTSRKGTWNLAVEDASGRQDFDFDLGAGTEGWNSLGMFEITEGEVRVEMSDDTDAKMILADAIRWIPTERTEVASR
jgi:ABC-type transport system involved in multi-copper enzyme maturation permease subunit